MELTPHGSTSSFVIPAIAKLSLGNADAFCPVVLQLFLSLIAQRNPGHFCDSLTGSSEE